MSGYDGHQIGLLRTIVRVVEVRTAVPPQRLTQEYMLAEGIAIAQPVPDGIVAVPQNAVQAYTDLLECLTKRSPAMERGAVPADVRREFGTFLAALLKNKPSSVGIAEVESLNTHFDEWFARLVEPCRVFVPCVISRWKAPRFSIGPAQFVFVDDIVNTEFYPSIDDHHGRSDLDQLTELMRKEGANWLARVSIEGCERQRAKQIADLATDLAAATLQFAVPHTAGISRLYAHRGTPSRLTLSEAGGRFYKDHSWVTPGQAIGTGTLHHFLNANSNVVSAAGDRIRAFSSGHFRLPKLELAWCDAAYWFHAALSEVNEGIAVAKLETALEVLMCAMNSKGSQARIEAILDVFYGLEREDPIHGATSTTARKFAKDFVEGRSRVLHGTVSTIQSRHSGDWAGSVEFVRQVLARSAVELNGYANSASPEDDHDCFLEWVKHHRP